MKVILPLLCLSLSSTAWAQRPERRVVSPEPTRAARVGAEIFGGTLATGVMVGLTALTALGISSSCDDDDDDDEFGLGCSFAVAGGVALIGVFLYAPAIAAGVYAGGNSTGGEGRYDVTLIGTTIGTVTGGLAMLVLARAAETDEAVWVGVGLTPVLQIAGGVIAYELSAGRSDRDRRYGPNLAVDRTGAVVGLTGRF